MQCNEANCLKLCHALPQMVAGKCVQLLDKADKKVAEQAQKMLVELVKYMGKPCLLFALSKLNEKDAKALETKLVRCLVAKRVREFCLSVRR